MRANPFRPPGISGAEVDTLLGMASEWTAASGVRGKLLLTDDLHLLLESPSDRGLAVDLLSTLYQYLAQAMLQNPHLNLDQNHSIQNQSWATYLPISRAVGFPGRGQMARPRLGRACNLRLLLCILPKRQLLKMLLRNIQDRSVRVAKKRIPPLRRRK